MRKQNEFGSYYVNDPDRVAAATDFYVEEIRAFVTGNSILDPRAMKWPAARVTNGESKLAIAAALAIVQREVLAKIAELAYSPGDFDVDAEDAA